MKSSIFSQREAEDALAKEATGSRYDEKMMKELAAQQVAPVHPRVAILEEGARLTNGDRDATYGDPIINLACSGELKAVFRKYMQRKLSTAELEAIDMVLTKVGRIATGPKFHRDTYVDAATYMAIAGEMAMRELDNRPESKSVTGL